MKATAKLKITTVRQGNGFDDMIREVENGIAHDARVWASDVVRFAKAKVPVRTGALQKSISAERQATTKHWQVKVGEYYGLYVEYGTRYMHAQPYLRPAVAAANKKFRENFKHAFDKARV